MYRIIAVTIALAVMTLGSVVSTSAAPMDIAPAMTQSVLDAQLPTYPGCGPASKPHTLYEPSNKVMINDRDSRKQGGLIVAHLWYRTALGQKLVKTYFVPGLTVQLQGAMGQYWVYPFTAACSRNLRAETFNHAPGLMYASASWLRSQGLIKYISYHPPIFAPR